MQDCEGAVDAGDGRSTFVITPSSHVQSKTGYCLSASAAGASAVPCSVDQGVTMQAVPGLDIAAAATVKDAAELLRAAAARQTDLLGQLKISVQACHGLLAKSSLPNQDTWLMASSHRAPSAFSSPATDVSQRIDAAAQVDMSAVTALIAESKTLLAAVAAA